ncbi:ABC transporter substrate-binding protein [Cupriavidus gilardii]|uniref:MlaC/ttg2D family ABC transporter substrate-binding protein n=1 Tax=Cupriavidus gilardii TaxID=82541 RepID=UPI0015725FE1|nr:ABC transporter substrate-binding protein [Cupriavidus gilardii]MCG5262717.1 ABC transporter substrate-binding protein [Cupriavidus gilardii]MDF9431610.1 ABC transporter substrate-binding protein [Cupriavidus gilardii]NSX02629.1 ABC transporter substrate-binding protein [Cupriavidus gilardii]
MFPFRSHSPIPALAIAVPALICPLHANAAERAAPDRLVRTAVEGVISAVRSDPSASAGDQARVVAVVRRQFLPYTDFARTTRLALGPAWRTANPVQQQQLVEQFRTLLVHTYALSLSQLRGQNVDFRYTPAESGANADDVVVRTRVITAGDENQIDYRLRRGADGWKIYDINMMGAWLIEVYRRQFADIVERDGIDGLIRYLSDHNARQAGSR